MPNPAIFLQSQSIRAITNVFTHDTELDLQSEGLRVIETRHKGSQREHCRTDVNGHCTFQSGLGVFNQELQNGNELPTDLVNLVYICKAQEMNRQT